VLNKVYVEEKTEIERDKALSIYNQSKPTVKPEGAEEVVPSESEDDDAIVAESDSDNEFRKVPDRLKKKTK